MPDLPAVVLLFEPSTTLHDHLSSTLHDIARILIAPAEPGRTAALSSARVAIGWRVSAPELQAAPQLGLFVNPGAGVQQLIPTFRELAEPPLLLNSHGNSYATAQHAVALLLALANRVVPHHNWMAAGRWRLGDESAATVPLRGLTIGLLGYGGVNSHVHRFLSGFELEFITLRRSSVGTPAGVTAAADLSVLLRAADILVCAVPLTDETRGMLGALQLQLLGEGAMLVNVARGPVLDEQALYVALKDGIIGGAALDVWYDYSPESDGQGAKRPYHYPFHELPNVVLSPHRAASPLDDLKRWDEVVDGIRRYLAGERPNGLVDIQRGY